MQHAHHNQPGGQHCCCAPVKLGAPAQVSLALTGTVSPHEHPHTHASTCHSSWPVECTRRAEYCTLHPGKPPERHAPYYGINATPTADCSRPQPTPASCSCTCHPQARSESNHAWCRHPMQAGSMLPPSAANPLARQTRHHQHALQPAAQYLQPTATSTDDHSAAHTSTSTAAGCSSAAGTDSAAAAASCDSCRLRSRALFCILVPVDSSFSTLATMCLP
jgi:hypothetical protein